MTTFNIKISGKESHKTTSSIAKILRKLDTHYLKGDPESSLILVEYISRGNWVTKDTLLSDQNSSCLLMSVFISHSVSEEDKAAFIKETFAQFNQLIGDLHKNSNINIQQYTANSYGKNKLTV